MKYGDRSPRARRRSDPCYTVTGVSAYMESMDRGGRARTPADLGSRWAGLHLRTCREARGISRSAAARAAGATSVHDVENFERRGPPASVQPLLAYALALHASDADLLALAAPHAEIRRREGHVAARRLARRRGALGLTQQQLQPLLAAPASRGWIARLERGEVALGAQKFLHYAVSVGANLRLLAELLSLIPAAEDGTAGDAPLAAMQRAARAERLDAVLAIAGRALDAPTAPGLQPRIVLGLALAFGLDRRWSAALFLNELAACDAAITEDDLVRSRIWRASLLTEMREAGAARRILANLATAVPPESALAPFVLYHEGSACLAAGDLARAASALREATRRSTDPNLALSSISVHALAAARRREGSVVARLLQCACDLVPCCDPTVAAFRLTELARAARNAGRERSAARLAHEANDRARAHGPASSALRALIELRELAAAAGDTSTLARLDERVHAERVGLHLDPRLRRYCDRVTARVAERRAAAH